MNKDQLIRPEVVSALAAGTWSERDARIAERSGYRCTYCGLDFLASALNYLRWTKDHLIPQKQGGSDDDENMVAACDICNKRKLRWNPRKVVGQNATREQMINAARAYIEAQLKIVEQHIIRDRAIVGWKPPLA